MSDESVAQATTPVPTPPPRRRRGWPKGTPRKKLMQVVAAEAPKEEVQTEAPKKKPSRWNMKAGNRWGGEMHEDSGPDRLAIPKEDIPEGMDLQWVTSEVFGQPQAQRRAHFEKNGWTPVHGEDFAGRFDGRYAPAGAQGEISVEGLVLMARPIEISERAHRRDRATAKEQVQLKEAQLTGGGIPVSLGPDHPSALRTNKIVKSYERISIPED